MDIKNETYTDLEKCAAHTPRQEPVWTMHGPSNVFPPKGHKDYDDYWTMAEHKRKTVEQWKTGK